VNVAQGGTEFGTPTKFTYKMKQWNWFFVNAYEFDSLIRIGTEILNWWLNEINVSVCWGFVATLTAFNFVVNSLLNLRLSKPL
jgi:hypothetical protein